MHGDLLHGDLLARLSLIGDILILLSGHCVITARALTLLIRVRMHGTRTRHEQTCILSEMIKTLLTGILEIIKTGIQHWLECSIT